MIRPATPVLKKSDLGNPKICRDLNYCWTFRPGNDAADVASSCPMLALSVHPPEAVLAYLLKQPKVRCVPWLSLGKSRGR